MHTLSHNIAITHPLQRVQRIHDTQPNPQRLPAADMIEGHCDVGDIELHYRHWPATTEAQRVLFLFHRGHEHGGRMEETAKALHQADTHVIAWDARGHGQSPGKRGHTPNGFISLIDDMDAFVHTIAAQLQLPIERCTIIAHSVAAVVATTWITDRNPNINGLVLLTPAFRVKLYVPGAIPALRLLNTLRPQAEISSYVRGKLLSHNQEAAEAYDNDPLISKAISNRVLVEMNQAAKRVVEHADHIRVPLLMVQAGKDWVVDNGTQDRFFRRCASIRKRRLDCPDDYHAVLHENDRHHIYATISDFINTDCTLNRPSDIAKNYTPVDDTHSWARYHKLNKKPHILNPKRWEFWAQRMALAVPGRLSKGIRIGWKHGFDSGSSLDHVYRNQAVGCTPIGRLIDRCYLDAIGWQGIRQRKTHIQQALTTACTQLRRNGEAVNVVDIAAGPGRYLYEFIQQNPDLIDHARLRDRAPAGVAEGQAIAEECGIQSSTHEIGDAFAEHHLQDCSPQPSIAIASGLYELFPHNDAILTSLRGIAEVLQSGQFCIYTNQPQHPQLEMIARVLPNREGDAWVMRCRPQAEMDALAHSVGLKKVRTWSDQWGIFTVTLAEKIAG